MIRQLRGSRRVSNASKLHKLKVMEGSISVYNLYTRILGYLQDSSLSFPLQQKDCPIALAVGSPMCTWQEVVVVG